MERIIKRHEFDWSAPVESVSGWRLVKVKENKDMGIYCYKREWVNQNGELNWCFEVVRPVKGYYPSSEQFGAYGVCVSKNDRFLQEKIDYYLNNGLSNRYGAIRQVAGFSTPYSQSIKQ